MRILVAGFLIAGSSAIGFHASAQEHPLFLPSRDVAVTYRLAAGTAGQQVTHLYYSAGLGAVRIDTPGGAGYTVLNSREHNQMLVLTTQHAYSVNFLPPGAEQGFILNDSMTFQRMGQDVIAGQPCVRWSVASSETVGSVCVTNDGVLLSGNGQPRAGVGPSTSLTALSVLYAQQSDDLFQAPPGFRHLSEQELSSLAGAPAQQPGQ